MTVEMPRPTHNIYLGVYIYISMSSCVRNFIYITCKLWTYMQFPPQGFCNWMWLPWQHLAQKTRKYVFHSYTLGSSCVPLSFKSHENCMWKVVSSTRYLQTVVAMAIPCPILKKKLVLHIYTSRSCYQLSSDLHKNY